MSRASRFIITRGVIDMATSAVLHNEGYWHEGLVALGRESEDDERVKSAVEAALKKHFEKVAEVHRQIETDLKTYKEIQEGTKQEVAKLNTDGAKAVADYQIEKEKSEARILALEQKLLTIGKAGVSPAMLKSLGERFIESEEWKNFAKQGPTMKRQSQPWQFKTTYAPIGSQPLSGGGGAFPEFLPTPVIPPFMPLTVRDLLGKGTTETNLIEWVKELVFTNQAGVVSEGATKPQSNITYERLNVPVSTIAHWIQASKQILADFKQLATLIDARLTWGLKQAEELQLLFGDGVGDNINGLVPQATAYSSAYGKPDDTRIDVLRHAMLQVQLAFYPTTGMVLSPIDWHDLELTKDKFGRYILASASQSTPPMVWGVPVVVGYTMNTGDFLVGAFQLAATIFDREQAQILVSTETGTNFIQNLVTILCEERLALAVTRPAAIIYGAFPAGSSDTV
jgi:HK97 family phage major capsid protein